MNSELDKFVNACTIKGESEEVGDSKKGNKQYKIIHSVYLLLKNNNRLGELLELLDHENPYVKLWASAYTLRISASQAEKTLIELASIKGRPVALNAEMTLREWKNGNLKFN